MWDEDETFFCRSCGYVLPATEEFLFPSYLERNRRDDIPDWSRNGQWSCKVCAGKAGKKYAAKRNEALKGRTCSVDGCNAPLIRMRSRTRCHFHHLGGSEALCGCVTCRAGWWTPQHIAGDSEKASQHCWLYLVRVTDGERSALVYGVSTVLQRRMNTYRQECTLAGLGLQKVAKAPGDLLSCVEAERWLSNNVSGVEALADISGMLKESAEDSESTMEAFHRASEWLQSHRRAVAPDDWEIRRISYL